MEPEQVWALIGEELVDRDRLRQRSGDRYVNWDAESGRPWVILDARFTADELEAFVWFMRHAELGKYMNWKTGETFALA